MRKPSESIFWHSEGDVLAFHSSCCLCSPDKYSPAFSDYLSTFRTECTTPNMREREENRDDEDGRGRKEILDKR